MNIAVHCPVVSPALKARDYKGPSSDGDGDGAPLVAHTLRAEGFDASEDGTGRGTPIIPIDMRQASRGETMTNNRREGTSGGAPGIGVGEPGDPAFTVSERGQAIAHVPDVGYALTDARGTGDGHGQGWNSNYVTYEEVAQPLRSNRYNNSDPGMEATMHIQQGMAVRRLTPRERERLQGFPDDWTRFAADGKEISDSARYRMLGNAVCVNVAEWIGKRIRAVDV